MNRAWLLLILALIGTVSPAMAKEAAGKSPSKSPTVSEKSPFAAVRWQESQPEVKVGEEWFKLVSLDGLPAADIVEFSRRTHRDRWQMRFEEDLVALLTAMGHPPREKVTLVVQSLTSPETRTLADVAMTEANRAAIKAAAKARPRGEQTQPRRGAISNDLLAEASQEPEKAVDVPAEALEKLVGVYELVPGLLTTVEAVDGKLMIGLMGQPPQQVFARSETVWFVQGVDVTFTFNVGKNGKADSLVMAQKQTFKRTKGGPAKDQQIAPPPSLEGKPEATAAAAPDGDKPVVDAKQRRRLVGRYQLAPNFIFDVRDVDGRLMVGITNQATQEVFPDSPTRWSYHGIKATIEFKLGKTGPAKSLVLIQDGAEQTAYRMK